MLRAFPESPESPSRPAWSTGFSDERGINSACKHVWVRTHFAWMGVLEVITLAPLGSLCSLSVMGYLKCQNYLIPIIEGNNFSETNPDSYNQPYGSVNRTRGEKVWPFLKLLLYPMDYSKHPPSFWTSLAPSPCPLKNIFLNLFYSHPVKE